MIILQALLVDISEYIWSESFAENYNKGEAANSRVEMATCKVAQTSHFPKYQYLITFTFKAAPMQIFLILHRQNPLKVIKFKIKVEMNLITEFS